MIYKLEKVKKCIDNITLVVGGSPWGLGGLCYA